jgi:hypothetical protein
LPRPRRNPVIREIQTLRQSLTAFDRSLRRLAWMVGQLNGSIERRRKRRSGLRKPLSAKARASLVLQGRYMGFMRQLKPRQKAQVRKVKEAKGVRAAIAKARAIARQIQ